MTSVSTPVRRAVRVAVAPAVPPILLLRLVGRVAFAGRSYGRHLVLASPLVFGGYCCWARGEMQGYLVGG